jgi:uncharacterized protein DUF3141
MRREREKILVGRSASQPPEAPKATPVPAEEASPVDAWSRLWTDASSYWGDAWQRGVLYLDVMRRRGNQYREHMAEKTPHVLSFTGELAAEGPVRGLQDGLRSGPRAGRQHQYRGAPRPRHRRYDPCSRPPLVPSRTHPAVDLVCAG